MAKAKPASTPKRPKPHIIESQSRNYVEKNFIDKGHTVGPPPADYGTDLSVHTFDEHGHKEAGEIQIQLKGRTAFRYSADGAYILFKIEVKHYYLWLVEPMPVFLVLFDATAVRAYYLYMQHCFTAANAPKPRKNAKEMTVHIPVANVFTELTVDYMRERKAAILEQIKGVKHEA